MKGIVLAGGLGTRLYPLTKVTNKCLLPIYNKPMVYYPIQSLVNAGIKDILMVCGGNAAGEFLRILGNGEDFGLRHLHYTYQSEPKGIADALSLAEEFVGDDSMCVILADNIFSENFEAPVKEFSSKPEGAVIFGYDVEHPEFYGVIEKDENGKVLQIIEKPKNPTGNTIATGLYLYDKTLWDFIYDLEPSARGELEITDVNNHYLKKGQLKVHQLKGWWADCGENIDGYYSANMKAKSLFGN
jgi:glucose-1-phosphate thymidylyltransferase